MSKKLFLLVFSTLLRDPHIAFSPMICVVLWRVRDKASYVICIRHRIHCQTNRTIIIDFEDFKWSLIRWDSYLFSFPLFNRTFSPTLYSCIMRPAFSRLLFLLIRFCFLCLIYSQFAVCFILNIISLPNTNCPGVCRRVVWKVDRPNCKCCST